jgi:hypothetical protein
MERKYIGALITHSDEPFYFFRQAGGGAGGKLKAQ